MQKMSECITIEGTGADIEARTMRHEEATYDHMEQQAAGREASELPVLLGRELPGIEVWMTVSNKDTRLHDIGKTPDEAASVFTNRTGITWRDAVNMGWKIVRANTSYKVTAELIE